MKKFMLVLTLLGTFIFVGCSSNNSNMEKKEMHGEMMKDETMMKKDKM